MEPCLGLILPARNEAAILGRTLSGILACVPPPDMVCVLADHCTDATAEVAAQAGAVVFRRDTGEAENKGLALRWLFEQWPPELERCTAVVIVDADSRLAPNFLAEVRQAVANGLRVGQCFVQPIELTTAPSARLGAYSDLLTQSFEARFNKWWGWPVRLRGMGMIFEPRLLRELLAHVHTRSAEDIELGLLAVDRGLKIHFVHQAVLYDPKPPDARRVTRQRARWIAGLFHVWRDYRALIVRLAVRSPRLWWWLTTMLLRPATLFFALKVGLWAVLLTLPITPAAQVAFGLWVGLDVLYYMAGLLLVPASERRHYVWALLSAPLYGVIWAVSLITAWRAPQRWLSVRHDDRP